MPKKKTLSSVVVEEPGITVAIPTIGRVETLPAVITSVCFQTYSVGEIIILDEAKTPIMESYAVNQALDVLSIRNGVEIKVIRSRRRGGIGAARLKLAEEALNDRIMMIDDDVVLNPACIEHLYNALQDYEVPWAVPTCFLVPANLELDGYIDTLVDAEDPKVVSWTEKYPWFVPYFRYLGSIERKIPVAGTQSIMLSKRELLSKAGDMWKLGNLPREDTYMTKKMGPGMFISRAECLHYEHPSQLDRGNWGKSTFYRLHEAIMTDPDGFLSMMKKNGVD